MSARIWGDAQLEVLSLGSKPITHGTYPVNFAEGEAWDHIDKIMESVNCNTIEEANAEMHLCILELIEQGIFQEFTPERGKFYKW